MSTESIPLARAAAPPTARPFDMWPLGHISQRAALCDFLLVLLLAVVLELIPGLLLYDPGEATFVPPAPIVMIMSKAMSFALVLTMALYFVVRNGISARAFGIRGDRLISQIAFVVPTFICIYAVMIPTAFSVAGIEYLITKQPPDLQAKVDFMDSLPAVTLGSSVVLFLLVGLHEELLFRGLLLPYLRRLTGSWIIAVVLTSILFGALHFHQGLSGVIVITVISAAFSVCFILTRSLLTVVLAHAAFDTFQMFMFRTVRPFLDNTLESMNETAAIM